MPRSYCARDSVAAVCRRTEAQADETITQLGIERTFCPFALSYTISRVVIFCWLSALPGSFTQQIHASVWPSGLNATECHLYDRRIGKALLHTPIPRIPEHDRAIVRAGDGTRAIRAKGEGDGRGFLRGQRLFDFAGRGREDNAAIHRLAIFRRPPPGEEHAPVRTELHGGRQRSRLRHAERAAYLAPRQVPQVQLMGVAEGALLAIAAHGLTRKGGGIQRRGVERIADFPGRKIPAVQVIIAIIVTGRGGDTCRPSGSSARSAY